MDDKELNKVQWKPISVTLSDIMKEDETQYFPADFTREQINLKLNELYGTNGWMAWDFI